jgi:hypothetical protein
MMSEQRRNDDPHLPEQCGRNDESETTDTGVT